MEILAVDFTKMWLDYIWPIFLFVAGLGLMIFVHELGHFLMAKRVGITVQRFALGMGPRLFGIKRGDTDYCINVLPLGGYVKMLGQDDFKALKDGDRSAQGSFESKSVGARFAVISAGVIMNLILAAVLFIIIGLVGKNFVAPIVGGTIAGDNASQARIVWQDIDAGEPVTSTGLESGDKILKIEGDSILLWVCGEEIEHFQDLMMTAALADPTDKYTVTIEREVEGKKRIGKTEMGLKFSGGMLKFGIAAPLDTVFAELEDVVIASPFRKNDRIVSIDGEKIEHLWQIDEIEKNLTGKPVTITVLRKKETVDIPIQPYLSVSGKVFHLKDGTVVRGEIIDRNLIEIEKTVDGKTKKVKLNEYAIRLADGNTRKILQDEFDPGPMRILGMSQRMLVLAVDEGSPAHKTGIKPGDVIVAYNGTKTPTNQQVREANKNVGDKGVEIIVLRDEKEKKFTLAPKKRNGQFLIGIRMAADTKPIAASVQPGSPAEKAGIPEEATITAINDIEVASWIDIYNALSSLTGEKVIISYQYNGQEQKAEIAKLDASAFHPDDYRFGIFAGDIAFKPLMVKIKQDGVIDSLAWGGRVTVKLVLSSYLSIRSLIRGWAPLDQTAGPIGIGSIAVKVGRRSFIDFLYFLGFISAAIAVFNFLPLPVVDGGFAVFLIIEKIRGKPLSVRVMNIVQIVGWVMLLGVFVLVTWNDIMRLVKNMW